MSEFISKSIDFVIAALYGTLTFLLIAGLGLAAFIFCTEFLSVGG